LNVYNGTPDSFIAFFAPPRASKKVHRGTSLFQIAKRIGKRAFAATRLVRYRLRLKGYVLRVQG